MHLCHTYMLVCWVYVQPWMYYNVKSLMSSCHDMVNSWKSPFCAICGKNIFSPPFYSNFREKQLTRGYIKAFCLSFSNNFPPLTLFSILATSTWIARYHIFNFFPEYMAYYENHSQVLPKSEFHIVCVCSVYYWREWKGVLACLKAGF